MSDRILREPPDFNTALVVQKNICVVEIWRKTAGLLTCGAVYLSEFSTYNLNK